MSAKREKILDKMTADLDKVKERAGEGNEFFLRMAYWTKELEAETEKRQPKKPQRSKA